MRAWGTLRGAWVAYLRPSQKGVGLFLCHHPPLIRNRTRCRPLVHLLVEDFKGVHCHHPLHGVTGRTRVITPGAGDATLDHPTPSPPIAMTPATWTATTAGETVGQRPRKPCLRKGTLPNFPRMSKKTGGFLLSKRPALSTALRQPLKTLAWGTKFRGFNPGKSFVLSTLGFWS